MTNQSTIQNQLNLKYLNKIQTEEIEILANELEGSLKIEDYPNLRKIKIASSVDSKQKGKIPKIELINLPKLEEVSIILCNLEELTFQNCPNVETLRLRQNKLSNLNFLNGLNSEKLTYLSIVNNNIAEQDLDYFRHFINLETLSIGNEPVSIREKKGNNQFKGSLEPLKDLTKLKYLHISKTNIDQGLDSLPLSIEKIYCDGKTDFVKPKTKFYQCSVIEGRLKKGDWRKSELILDIENGQYFSIESSKLKMIDDEFDNFISKSNYRKEDIDSVLIRRGNKLINSFDEDSFQQELPFWIDPATTNKIACWNSGAATIAFIVAIIVGIPAFLALNK